LLLLAFAGVTPGFGQTPGEDEGQIARAVLAAPESMRAGATVLGYGGEARDGDPLTVLREGANGIVCLADDPERDGFHVACYHESMDPFMALGRRLRARGEDRASRSSTCRTRKPKSSACRPGPMATVRGSCCLERRGRTS
jgi:hypothetical protein